VAQVHFRVQPGHEATTELTTMQKTRPKPELFKALTAMFASPAPRPYRGWEGSEERARLQLQDARGAAIEGDTVTLLADHTYTIPAPELLQQKEKMFVGYMQPYVPPPHLLF